jgi:hypothetical protein
MGATYDQSLFRVTNHTIIALFGSCTLTEEELANIALTFIPIARLSGLNSGIPCSFRASEGGFWLTSANPFVPAGQNVAEAKNTAKVQQPAQNPMKLAESEPK